MEAPSRIADSPNGRQGWKSGFGSERDFATIALLGMYIGGFGLGSKYPASKF